MTVQPDRAPPRHRLSILCRLFLTFVIIGALTPPALLGCILFLPWRLLRIRVGSLYGRAVGWTIFRMAGISPQLEGNNFDRRVACLVVSNHSSTVDMWIGMWLNPKRSCGVAKREILKIPFFGFIYWLSGHLMLDRSNRETAIASMVELGTFVREHTLGIWMWPEGRRSQDGRLRPFKKGFVHLAIATGLPIQPIVSHDADLMWPSRSLQIRPGPLRMVVLDPIDTSGWRSETVDQHIEEVRRVFQAELSPRQQGEDAGYDGSGQ
jgi:lysophosphatidate acyltransferase